MRLGSWMYGACAQIAVTVFTVCGLVLALPVVSLFIMVLNGMQDATFVVFSILLLLLFYALGWIWAVSFAREWKVKLFELQVSSLIPLAGILYLYIDSGVSIPELIHDWHEDGCVRLSRRLLSACAHAMRWCWCLFINQNCGMPWRRADLMPRRYALFGETF